MNISEVSVLIYVAEQQQCVSLSVRGEGMTLSSDSVSIKLELSSVVCHNGPGKHCQCPSLLSDAQQPKKKGKP